VTTRTEAEDITSEKSPQSIFDRLKVP